MKEIERRAFLQAAIFPLINFGESSTPQGSRRLVRVEHGKDPFNEKRTMETFFREAAKIPDFAADQALYRACEMEIVGPRLSLPQ